MKEPKAHLFVAGPSDVDAVDLEEEVAGLEVSLDRHPVHVHALEELEGRDRRRGNELHSLLQLPGPSEDEAEPLRTSRDHQNPRDVHLQDENKFLSISIREALDSQLLFKGIRI